MLKKDEKVLTINKKRDVFYVIVQDGMPLRLLDNRPIISQDENGLWRWYLAQLELHHRHLPNIFSENNKSPLRIGIIQFVYDN